jgi:hypothetical protein
VLLAIGGSDDAQRILPHFRIFRKVESTCVYALPLRPLRQILRSAKNYKTPARLLRNILWNSKRQRSTNGWSAELVREPGAEWNWNDWITPVLDSGVIPLRRSTEWLRYLMKCPSAPVSVFSINADRGNRGYAAVSLVQNQARIVDLLIGSRAELDWANALTALTTEVAKFQTADEIFARTSVPLFGKALVDVGYVQRGEQSVYLADPAGKLRDTKLEINCMVGDQMYLHTPDAPYLT